jgi:transcriptional regulator with XRE-family HTH domain
MSKEIIVDNSKCGGIVKQVRLQLRCTQEELGKKIGIDQPTMCRIERRQQMPTEPMLQKIANLAGLNMNQMTGQEPINYAAIW